MRRAVTKYSSVVSYTLLFGRPSIFRWLRIWINREINLQAAVVCVDWGRCGRLIFDVECMLWATEDDGSDETVFLSQQLSPCCVRAVLPDVRCRPTATNCCGELPPAHDNVQLPSHRLKATAASRLQRYPRDIMPAGSVVAIWSWLSWSERYILRGTRESGQNILIQQPVVH